MSRGPLATAAAELALVSTLLLVVVASAFTSQATRFRAYCNYQCGGCPDPAAYDIAACNRTSTGSCNSNSPRGCWSQGHFPVVNAGGEPVANGGLPQLANLSLHLEALTTQIDTYMPEVNFDGNAVLDFEAWTPIFDQNTNPDYTWHGLVYQLASIALVKKQHPTWENITQIVEQARADFEAAGLAFFVSTLRHLRRLRPKARWGFYGFPAGFYAEGCGATPAGTRCGYQSPTLGSILRQQNDNIAALWAESAALYPSVYLPAAGFLPESMWQQLLALYVNDTVAEAVRLAGTFPSPGNGSIPVLPFAWALYHNGSAYLTAADMQLVVVQAYHPPLATGVIIWGGGFPAMAPKLPAYVRDVEGPIFETARKRADACAAAQCGGHGWCVNPFGGSRAFEVRASCVCDEGWSATFNCTRMISQ